MSEYKYLDKDGLIYYHSKVKTLLGGKVDKETGKGLSTNDYTTTEKNKLSGIASGAEVNQNAFSNIAVGSTTIAADSKTDTLTLTAGSNITLTPNATSDTITIAAATVTVDSSLSSTSTNPVQNKVINTALGNKVDKVNGKGLSTNDYTTDDMNKLAGIEGGAQVNQYAFSEVEIGRRIIEANQESSPLYIEAGDNVALTVLDNEGLNYGFRISATDTTYSDATTSTHGLMSAADKVKLNGIAEGATANVGTITGVSMNGTSVATSGVANITSLPASILNGAIKNGVTATTQSAGDNSTKVATTAFVGTAITNALASITQISYEVVQTLPQTGEAGVIYLVSNGGSSPNSYDEYIWIGGNNARFEKIGTTAVDLSGYVQKTEMVSITNAEIDTIVA